MIYEVRELIAKKLKPHADAYFVKEYIVAATYSFATQGRNV